MFCEKCGTQIPDDALFCPGCGQKTSNGAQQAAPQSAQQSVQPRPQMSYAPQQPAQNNSKKLIGVIIAIAAVFLVVAVIFGILILGKLGDKDDDSDKKGKKDNKTKTEQSVDSDDEDDADESDDADSDDEEASAEDADSEDSDSEEAGASGDASALIAERFPKLVEGYKEPKSENTFWIPVDDETREKLDNLNNDYNKIAWVVEYAYKGIPAMVTSFTINENCGVPYVILGFTNVGDVPLCVDGTAEIYDFDKNKLASGYPYTGMIQPGGTYICPIACPGVDMQNIDVGYTDLTLDYAKAVKPGDYSATASLGDSTSSNIVTSISVENTCSSKELMGQITVLLLDENGFPVANGYVFGATSTDPGATLESDVTIGILEEDIAKVSDIAVFASPYITG